MALTQAEQYEPFWRKHRDDWRPCTPDDVHGLAEDRTFTPPSRAHLKRLARAQREHEHMGVVKPRPRVNDAARIRHNEAAAHGARIAALLGYVKPTIR